jgi:hypothetical protein
MIQPQGGMTVVGGSVEVLLLYIHPISVAEKMSTSVDIAPTRDPSIGCHQVFTEHTLLVRLENLPRKVHHILHCIHHTCLNYQRYPTHARPTKEVDCTGSNTVCTDHSQGKVTQLSPFGITLNTTQQTKSPGHTV